MSATALQSLELIERLYAESGVAAPKLEEQSMRWVGTSLGIAGVPLLVGEGELEEIVETPPVTPIPGTKPWVMGVAAYKGGLLPVFSGDVLFRNRAYTGRVRDYCMVIRRPGVYFGITLSHVERDLRLPIEDRIVDHPVDPDFAKFTLGGFMYKGEFLAVLDIDTLVADEEVADASAARNSSIEGENDEQ
ncbi:MAG: chemotaxis protein CheW [Halioglobus sp.]|nr:chemotaxis protein CheW [Halioglobus sp.]